MGLLLFLVLALGIAAAIYFAMNAGTREGLRRGRRGWRRRGPRWGPARPSWVGPVYDVYEPPYVYGCRHMQSLCQARCGGVYEDCRANAAGDSDKLAECSNNFNDCVGYCVSGRV